MSGKRILIVDDEADIALILKLQLEDTGFQTLRARDGVEALEILEREEFSLILLDIRMPRMGGLQVLEKVVVDYPELAVMMMTAHGSEDIAVAAMKHGAIDYIAKPFSSDDLVKRVERAIEFNETKLANQRLERQLAEERRQTEAILQGMADILVAIDTEGRIIRVNRQVETIFGGSGEELLGRRVEDLLHADIPAEHLPCRTVLRSKAPCLDMTYNMQLGGISVPVLSSATPLMDDTGRLLGSVEIIRDISALKVLEQEKEDFVSMLSHDLKTPLTAIVGSTDLVREGKLGPINDEQREYMESAIESCNEMVEMIDTLLDVHKFEAKKMKLFFQKEEPESLIRKLLTRFEPVARRGELRLIISIGESIPPISVDRGKFSRLLGNLLSNAVKFTPEGGEIEVTARDVVEFSKVKGAIPSAAYPFLDPDDSRRFVRIMVRDSGVGIPADALETIFDRFVQANNRRLGKTSGTGLGLAFCRKVMDAHNGFIWAESVAGKGSTFVMLFPVDDKGVEGA
jgi:PAS domain S-box-containing protein